MLAGAQIYIGLKLHIEMDVLILKNISVNDVKLRWQLMFKNQVVIEDYVYLTLNSV